MALTSAAHADSPAKNTGILKFDLKSVQDGPWSSPDTWEPKRAPARGDRVMVSRGTRVLYDVASDEVIRLIQVIGTLSFAKDRDTLLNVGILKVQNSDACSESGFACDFLDVNELGKPKARPDGAIPALEVGTLTEPIPAEFTARIRLHFLDGMDRDDAPALACCSRGWTSRRSAESLLGKTGDRCQARRYDR